MFWIGAAPTVPGISDRFSSPVALRQRPFSNVPVLASAGAHSNVGILGDQRPAGDDVAQDETVEILQRKLLHFHKDEAASVAWRVALGQRGEPLGSRDARVERGSAGQGRRVAQPRVGVAFDEIRQVRRQDEV